MQLFFLGKPGVFRWRFAKEIFQSGRKITEAMIHSCRMVHEKCQQRSKIPQIQRSKFPHPLIKFPLNFQNFYQEVKPTFVELSTHASSVL
jgi:hypothetical protein